MTLQSRHGSDGLSFQRCPLLANSIGFDGFWPRVTAFDPKRTSVRTIIFVVGIAGAAAWWLF
jgi:hypothetical protein